MAKRGRKPDSKNKKATDPALAPQPENASNPRPVDFKADADHVNMLHGLLTQADKDNLSKAVEIGKRLEPIRDKLKDGKRGKWLEWVKENLKFSDTTARSYIKVASLDAEGLLKNVTGLNEAYHVLGKQFPGKRKAKKEKEMAAAISYKREPMDVLASGLARLDPEKKDIAAVQVTASSATELAARLKFAMAKHAKTLASEAVAIIVIKMTTPETSAQ